MNEPFNVNCPHCQARIRVAAGLEGKTRSCPNCNQRMELRRPMPSDADVRIIPWREDDVAAPV